MTLVRRTHPHLGHISPGEFIPLAERNDLIMDLTCWVLRQVCVDQQTMQDVGLTEKVAINLSPLLLYRDNRAEHILA
ncbi:EAL domain-containing protein [Alteromonas salexigens]|uniref:EAL domain-containing protein n=1 Tax=Alteromonas salexigens TaxID=2982530 RepID=UPI00357151CA